MEGAAGGGGGAQAAPALALAPAPATLHDVVRVCPKPLFDMLEGYDAGALRRTNKDVAAALDTHAARFPFPAPPITFGVDMLDVYGLHTARDQVVNFRLPDGTKFSHLCMGGAAFEGLGAKKGSDGDDILYVYDTDGGSPYFLPRKNVVYIKRAFNHLLKLNKERATKLAEFKAARDKLVRGIKVMKPVGPPPAVNPWGKGKGK